MITLRLFRSQSPFQEIESRELSAGEIVLGRDPAADWTIQDEADAISRRHCRIRVDGQQAWLTDTSTNGVFVGVEKLRAPRDRALALSPGDPLHIGDYILLVDGESPREIETQPSRSSALERPSRPSTPLTDAGLLEAFCHGAQIDASSFAGESPTEVFHRLGGVYRQVIEDLSSLLGDRAMARNSLQLERTTISARDNNPLKWTSPDRAAIDLLREDEGGGFLKGEAAIRASFADIRRHGACLMAASRSAVGGVLSELAPETIETGVRKSALNFGRYEAAWKQLQQRHAELSLSFNDSSGLVEQRFREGYEARSHQLSSEEEAA